MDWMKLAEIAGSGLVVALLTAIFGKAASDKSIRIDNVTKERAAWRARMRELVKETNESFSKRDRARIRTIKAEVQVKLNPGDTLDNLILDSLDNLQSKWSPQYLNDFNVQMAALLKHDWERVKDEVSGTRFVSTLAVIGMALIVTIVTLVLWFTQDGSLAQSFPRNVVAVSVTLVIVSWMAWGTYTALGADTKIGLARKRKQWQHENRKIRGGHN